MGDWVITVLGTGIHHNGNPKDADQLFKQIMELIEAAGSQTVLHASFTSGGRMFPGQVLPLKEV